MFTGMIFFGSGAVLWSLENLSLKNLESQATHIAELVPLLESINYQEVTCRLNHLMKE